MTKPRFSEGQEGGLLGHRIYRPRYTREFDTYPDADAWLTAGGYTEFMIDVRWSGETTVTLEDGFAERALDREHPIAPGGFRLFELE